MFKSFLIKYAEIGVKGKNRYIFENALVDNAKRALDKIDGEFQVTKENGRVYATALSEYDYDEAVDALQHVFGIVGICPMVQIRRQRQMCIRDRCRAWRQNIGCFSTTYRGCTSA